MEKGKFKISVGLGVTLQLRQYESIRLDVGYEEEFSPDMPRKMAFAKGWNLVEKELQNVVKDAAEKVDKLRDEKKKDDPDELPECFGLDFEVDSNECADCSASKLCSIKYARRKK